MHVDINDLIKPKFWSWKVCYECFQDHEHFELMPIAWNYEERAYSIPVPLPYSCTRMYFRFADKVTAKIKRGPEICLH